MSNETQEQDESPQEDYSNLKFKELQVGVWKLKIASAPSTVGALSPAKQWVSLKSEVVCFLELSGRVFSISPSLFTIFILCMIWSGIETSITLQLSNNLLRAIEERLTVGKSNEREIINATILRVVCAVFGSYLYWYRNRMEERLETCVTRHYKLLIIEANVGIDLPTFRDGGNRIEVDSDEAWDSITNIIHALTLSLKLAMGLLMILHLSLNNGGPLFSVLCLIQPLCSAFSSRGIWGKAVFGYINNPDYQRIKALEGIVHQDKYREDLISGGLARWITDEFRQASKRLGFTPDAAPLHAASLQEPPIVPMFLKTLGELPMIFCACNVLFHPERFSVSSLAVLQQSASSLSDSLGSVLAAAGRFRESMININKIYKSTKVVNQLKSGDTPYLRENEMESLLINPRKGMSFQLRDVSFSYAGAQKKTPALTNVSLTIKPGQLVVIVGGNGSGKSTLIRILSRLYDPTSGEILIDDLPSSEYRIDDLHKSTVLLSQNSDIYPLSLGENIGLGLPECASDMDMVAEAARLGGACDFIGKLDRGLNTTLKAGLEKFCWNFLDNKEHPLYKEMQDLTKDIDISGGERQRVVAARAFMRFNSGKVNFVAVDEPTSALDAEGELQLFKNLLAAREGKTMVFVTHRFGHLTKYADLIICMKDGSIVESGTHAELIDRKGEYLSLYNIQAEAFSD